MTTEETQNQTDTEHGKEDSHAGQELAFPTNYMVRFRENEQVFSAGSRISNLKAGEIVMVQTDHGPEPVKIQGLGPLPISTPEGKGLAATYTIARRSNREEIEKYKSLINREKEALAVCRKFIEKHNLAMKLIKVERFFNGSKIIFYFTAENRVDFRELVKDLVQEFRTRVEIRQIGVRHETKMLGGVGSCGRELCCCSYIKKFSPVSIKMAKEQNLPLNPAKISGICNRLLCCLTYEYNTYKAIRKRMPKIGKNITVDGQTFKVLRHDVLHDAILVTNIENQDKPIIMGKDDWEKTGEALENNTSSGPEKKRKPAGSRKNKKPDGK